MFCFAVLIVSVQMQLSIMVQGTEALGNDWMDQLNLPQSVPSPQSIPIWTLQRPARYFISTADQ